MLETLLYCCPSSRLIVRSELVNKSLRLGCVDATSDVDPQHGNRDVWGRSLLLDQRQTDNLHPTCIVA